MVPLINNKKSNDKSRLDNQMGKSKTLPCSVLIIDDHPLFRVGIHFLLGQLEESLTIYESNNYEEAVELADQHSLDLILLDLNMPGMSGVSAMEMLINKYHVPVIVISGNDEPATIMKSIECGACGFIPKSSSPDVLIAALRLVLVGGVYIPPEAIQGHIGSSVVEHKIDSFESMVVQLSERQREVLLLAINGKANKVIARELKISEGTVKSHLSLAYKTFGVKNRTEAIITLAHLGQEGYLF